MIKLKKHPGNPILSPDSGHPWESLVVTNPGAVRDPVTGKILLLYRCAGDDPEHVVRFGLAESVDGIHFVRSDANPVFEPSREGHFDAGCVEDPRITPFGDEFLVTYACRHSPPGQYWLNEGNPVRPPAFPEFYPAKLRGNLTTTALAVTRDFRFWRRLGPITDPRIDDRDVYFFPEKIGGKFWMIHRPMEWTGARFGTEHPAMWINSSEDLLHWDSSTSRLLAKAQADWEVKIGGNTPPIRTPLGWLTLYHGKGPDGFYRLGALVLDAENPAVVRYRTRDWLAEPEHEYETMGCYDMGGVIFPCGKVVLDDTLYVYYGAADKYVGLATCSFSELLDDLSRQPVEETR
jgi:predicted GH43/DUF377 family glycosyl hydrolase